MNVKQAKFYRHDRPNKSSVNILRYLGKSEIIQSLQLLLRRLTGLTNCFTNFFVLLIFCHNLDLFKDGLPVALIDSLHLRSAIG